MSYTDWSKITATWCRRTARHNLPALQMPKCTQKTRQAVAAFHNVFQLHIFFSMSVSFYFSVFMTVERCYIITRSYIKSNCSRKSALITVLIATLLSCGKECLLPMSVKMQTYPHHARPDLAGGGRGDKVTWSGYPLPPSPSSGKSKKNLLCNLM